MRGRARCRCGKQGARAALFRYGNCIEFGAGGDSFTTTIQASTVPNRTCRGVLYRYLALAVETQASRVYYCRYNSLACIARHSLTQHLASPVSPLCMRAHSECASARCASAHKYVCACICRCAVCECRRRRSRKHVRQSKPTPSSRTASTSLG